MMRACFCAVVVLALAAGLPAAQAADPLPEGAKGFAGMITGKVITKGDAQVVVEVSKIDRVWKHNKAENPASLIGRRVTIRIVPQVYEKKEGYLVRVRQFFGLLKAGDSESFDVKHSEGDSLIFLELTKAQMERLVAH